MNKSSLAKTAGLLGSVLAFAPNGARAFCRTTTAPTAGTCPEACPATGVLLAWGTPEIEYAFNEKGFSDLDDAQFRAAIARGFDHWAKVSCNGTSPGFSFMALAQTTPLTVGPMASEPNLNVISDLPRTDWQSLHFADNAFAKTQVWFDTSTGEILGADIAFNRAIGTMAICPDSGCPADVIDLENVATHEIGHFLGLAHSSDMESTMWCDAVRGDLKKRTLAADDEAGLCAIYGSRDVFQDPVVMHEDTMKDSSSSSGGCAMNERANAPVFGLLGLLALLRRRRKR